MKKALLLLSFLPPFLLFGEGDILLNTLAVKSPDGTIQVLGTEGAYNNSERTKERVFDGNPTTDFDPPLMETAPWVGLKLERPMIVTRIRYVGGIELSQSRIRGSLFEASNSADFSNAVLLHTANPPEGWKYNQWVEVLVQEEGAFRYLRLRSPKKGSSGEGVQCGNIGELEFYGRESETLPEGVSPTPPAISFAAILNGRLNIRFSTDPQGNFPIYQIERSEGEEKYTPLETVDEREGPQVIRTPAEPFWGRFRYRVLAKRSGGTAVSAVVSATNHAVLPAEKSASFDGGYGNLSDGDMRTLCTIPAGGWISFAFTKPSFIEKVRLLPGPDGIAGCRLEIADDPAFSTPLFAQTLGESPGDGIIELIPDIPCAGRYARLLAAEASPADLAEIEFVEPDAVIRACDAHLKTLAVDPPWKVFPTLSWTYPEGSDPLPRLFRSTAPGGPWTPITWNAPKENTTTWSDQEAEEGIRYFYKIGFLIGGIRHATPLPVSGIRVSWLERHPEDPTMLRPGVEALTRYPVYKNHNISWIFDGDLSRNIEVSQEPNRVGADLGRPCEIIAVRVYPRESWTSRLNGAYVVGVRDGESWETEGVDLSGPIRATEWNQRWYAARITDKTPYRYVFLEKKQGFYSNINEMEIWGFSREDGPADLLLAPESVTLSESGESLTLTWEPSAHASGYRIEKRERGGIWSEIGSVPAPGSTFTETDPPVEDIERWIEYRIGALRGEEVAWSESLNLIRYRRGEGTGLFRSCQTEFSPNLYNPNGISFTNGVDPSIDFNWGSGEIAGGHSDNIANRWTGKILIPVEERYTFTLRSDDGSALWIDGIPIVNNWSAGSHEHRGSLNLTKGEHDIRVDHWEGENEAHCVLLWECPGIKRETVPQSQLIPVPPSALPDPWQGERSFNQPLVGQTLFTPDGKVELTAGGRDFSGGNEGFHLLWTLIEGDFDVQFEYSYKSGTSGKLMLMARKGLETGAPFVSASIYDSPNNDNMNFEFQVRNQQNAGIRNTGASFSGKNGGFRLIRIGNTFRGFRRASGEEWVQLASPFVADAESFPAQLYVGPGLTSYTPDLASFVLSGIRVKRAGGDTHLPPATTAFSPVEGKPTLAWTPVPGSEGYRIQRKKSDGSWVTVAESQTETRYIHPETLPEGHLAIYRVGSIRDGETLFTPEISFSFEAGEGTGLHATYRHPYTANGYNPGETVVSVQTNLVNYDAGSEEIVNGIKDNIAITWNGKIIIPIQESYTFSLRSDDGAALWIGGKPVINNLWNGYEPYTQYGSVTLEAGEHPIRVDHCEGGGGAHCVLMWRAALIREGTVPASQLIPVPDTPPAPWQGERTFNQKKKGGVFFREGENRAEFWCGGGDYSQTGDSRHQLWTSREGDFELSLKYRWDQPPADPHACPKLMLMVRETLEIGSPSWAVAIRNRAEASSFLSFRRPDWNAPLEETGSLPGGEEGELRAIRLGQNLFFYGRATGRDPWTRVGPPYKGELPPVLLIGPAVSTDTDTLQHYTVSELTLREAIPGSLIILE